MTSYMYATRLGCESPDGYECCRSSSRKPDQRPLGACVKEHYFNFWQRHRRRQHFYIISSDPKETPSLSVICAVAACPRVFALRPFA